MTRATAIAEAFRRSCLDELQALKPGNVHVHADGHGMTVAQFEHAAEAAAAVIAGPELTVGGRIEVAVEASWRAAGCNTNLGILLLAAPLVEAALVPMDDVPLRSRLADVLDRLTVADAEAAYRAIRRASPAGLGAVPEHDVGAVPRITLRAAMAVAQHRDCIARQYVTTYADVFSHGLPPLRTLKATDPVAAVEAVHLGFMAAFPDTHIARKFGTAAAEGIRAEAARLQVDLARAAGPAHRDALRAFDRSLKARGLNPGTSADLTVATLLVERLEFIVNFSGRGRMLRPSRPAVQP